MFPLFETTLLTNFGHYSATTTLRASNGIDLVLIFGKADEDAMLSESCQDIFLDVFLLGWRRIGREREPRQTDISSQVLEPLP